MPVFCTECGHEHNPYRLHLPIPLPIALYEVWSGPDRRELSSIFLVQRQMEAAARSTADMMSAFLREDLERLESGHESATLIRVWLDPPHRRSSARTDRFVGGLALRDLYLFALTDLDRKAAQVFNEVS